jgi:hypothetical protein
MLSTALALAARGLSIFPCRPGLKTPAFKGSFEDATREPEQIKEWWASTPDFNIAVATGDKSGLFVVDVDNEDGFAALTKCGVIPDTIEAVTANGTHFYFRMPAFDLRNSVRKLGPGLDIRANGGYVLAPPSLHPSGKRYAWSVDSANKLANPPQWLLDKLTDRPHAPRADVSQLMDDVAEGQRNDRITRLAGHLLRHRVHIQMTASLLLAWNKQHCNPPLEDEEVLRTIDSISKCETRRRAH